MWAPTKAVTTLPPNPMAAGNNAILCVHWGVVRAGEPELSACQAGGAEEALRDLPDFVEPEPGRRRSLLSSWK
jgi:hypothetical protein